MRILIIGLNFYPELTGIGKFTGEMAAYLSQNEAQVRVITTPPYYPHWQVQPGYTWWHYRRENWGNVRIFRCPLWVPRRPSGLTRLLYMLSFAFSSLPVLLGQLRWKPDLVLCVVPSFFNAPFALGAAWLYRAATWLHIQDFELDAAQQLGMLPENHPLTRLAARFERWILRRYDVVSTISARMVGRAHQKGVAPQNVILFPNWVDTQLIRPLDTPRPSLLAAWNLPPNKTIILYAGNMGRKHGLEVVVTAAQKLSRFPEILFVLCGEGAARPDLERAAQGLRNIVFLPLQPLEKLNSLLNLADIHVLPQRAGAADLVMPSKLSGMLASGKPVIATADPQTEIETVLNGLGRVVPPEDADALQAAILELVQNPNLRIQLGQASRNWVEQNWSKNVVLARFLSDIRIISEAFPPDEIESPSNLAG